MTILEQAALIFTALWLGVLSVAVMILVRQVGLLTLRLALSGPPSSESPGAGPTPGSPIPRSVMTLLPQLRGGTHYLLALASTCGPCRSLLEELCQRTLPEPIVALVTGPADQTAAMAALLPGSWRVLKDPDAAAILSQLDIHTTPFVLEVTDGAVAGYVNSSSADDVVRFMEHRVEHRVDIPAGGPHEGARSDAVPG